MMKELDKAIKALEFSKGRIINLSSMCSERDLKHDMEHTIPKIDEAIRALQERQTVDVGEWSYCPECGHDGYDEIIGGEKICTNCGQSWFSDIDYTDVVRHKLQHLTTPDTIQVKRDGIPVGLYNALKNAEESWFERNDPDYCCMDARALRILIKAAALLLAKEQE